MKKILIFLKVIEIADNEVRYKQKYELLGNQCKYAQRINPWNPLSYLVVMFIILFHLVFYGINGLVFDWINPFKWR